ncbi:peptidoglycan DD-metalloendopeptidase family protein [Pseudophaeobacter leonis]|uniref:peptidoglycan DD-metalloendopeptidase family protein n=1 Tax=Pseudophaeobacter leonis TaxID=1144477 RepID=UPI0009F444ED|nr:peptidoglycan DD-metalloendopeptidase family protein [Pseudophaeobacter leonis]
MTTGSPKLRSARARMALATVPMLALLAGCEGPLDYDLRGQIGGFNTTAAAQTATTNRPAPDARGLITYPSYQVAVAERGDTVSDLASRIGLPITEVAKFNGMQPGDSLRKGEVLVLPRRAPDSLPAVATTASPGAVDIAALAGNAIEAAPATSPNPGSVTTTTIQSSPKPRPAPVQNGPEPLRHKVKRGETAYTISRLYQVPVKSLAEWNGLGSDFAIREGQQLLIPLKDQKAARSAPDAQATTAPGQGSATPTPPSATKPLPQENLAPASVAPANLPTVDVPAPSRPSQAAMAYPVQGKIVKTYSKGRNDGIDIAAAAGASVKAAEAGTIAAITKDSQNIPIVVIRHDPKLLTIYANIDKISVAKGDKVKRGQVIGTLQDTAGATLHFEVRNGYDSLDPLPYLN